MSVAHAEKGFSSPEAPEPGSLGHLALVPEVSVQPVVEARSSNLHIGPIDLINCQLTPAERVAVELLGANVSDTDTFHHTPDRLPLQ